MNPISLKTNEEYKRSQSPSLLPILQDLVALAETTAPAQQIINDTIEMTGTTASTTTTYMEYAYNVITTASATAYAARLPNPPTKGKSCTVINTSGVPIVIYPSVMGGSINGVVNGSALIPSDGKPYVFFCYENPLPGAWTWTPPATNQYDSGEITVTTQGGSKVITCVAPNFYNNSNGLSASGGGATNPLFMKDVSGTNGLQSLAKPSTMWNSITKVKVYTNILTLNVTAGGVGLYSGGNFSVVDTVTGLEYGITPVQRDTPPYLSDITSSATWQTVAGTPTAGAYSANIGDAGTKYIEMSCSYFAPHAIYTIGDVVQPNGNSSNFGSDSMGLQLDPSDGIVYEKWFTQYFWLYIIPRGTAGGALKIRFFIEYN